MFPRMFCHPTVGNFDIFPYSITLYPLLAPLPFSVNDLIEVLSGLCVSIPDNVLLYGVTSSSIATHCAVIGI